MICNLPQKLNSSMHNAQSIHAKCKQAVNPKELTVESYALLRHWPFRHQKHRAHNCRQCDDLLSFFLPEFELQTVINLFLSVYT